MFSKVFRSALLAVLGTAPIVLAQQPPAPPAPLPAVLQNYKPRYGGAPQESRRRRTGQ